MSKTEYSINYIWPIYAKLNIEESGACLILTISTNKKKAYFELSWVEDNKGYEEDIKYIICQHFFIQNITKYTNHKKRKEIAMLMKIHSINMPVMQIYLTWGNCWYYLLTTKLKFTSRQNNMGLSNIKRFRNKSQVFQLTENKLSWYLHILMLVTSKTNIRGLGGGGVVPLGNLWKPSVG